jgi:phospholipid/cholesterol/gamma-HCH transport system substrate-binding protein
VKRTVRFRLAALLVVVLIGCGYTVFEVIGWRIGAQRYHVTVMLPRAGGVYPAADVTYRGVSVGKVAGLQLLSDGVAADLAINPGVKIPANSTATVKELSAIGEQYLDLVPGSPGGPALASGGVIPLARAAVPTSIDTALIDFSRLLSTINPDDIVNLNHAFATGLGGTGNDLRNTIEASQNFISAITAAEPATVQLIVGGNKVLTTALATSTDFANFTAGLDKVTGQFKASNSDFQAVINNGVAFENQLSQLLAQTNNSNIALTSAQGAILDIAAARNPAIQGLFKVLPVFANQLALTTANGQIHSELLFNSANTVCTYLPANQIPPPTQATGPPNLNLTCANTAADLLQRGEAHAPAP